MLRSLAGAAVAAFLLAPGLAAAQSGAVAYPQGQPTAGQWGPLMQCAVTTSAPGYTTALTMPLSCDLFGNLRVTGGGAGGGGPATAVAGAFADGALVTEGATTDAACAGDNTSGCSLEARVERLTQRVTALINLFPTGLGQSTLANGLRISPASDWLLPPFAAVPAFKVDQTSPGSTNLVQDTAGAPNPVNISTATTTQIIALSSGKAITVTGGILVAGGSDNVTFEYGTGTACATGTNAISGAMNLLTGGGFKVDPFTLPPSQAFCVVTSGAVQLSGYIAAVQQ